MNDDEITIRPLQAYDEIKGVEALQLIIWPGSEMDIVPNNLLLAIAHSGGVVLGAFDGDALVGIVMGFNRQRIQVSKYAK